MYIHIYIYIHIIRYVYTYIHNYIYIYTYEHDYNIYIYTPWYVPINHPCIMLPVLPHPPFNMPSGGTLIPMNLNLEVLASLTVDCPQLIFAQVLKINLWLRKKKIG